MFGWRMFSCLRTCCEDVECWVCRHHPEPVVLASEGVQTGALRHVPHTDALVLTVAQDELLARVEHDAGDVVVVAATGVDLPGFGVCNKQR